VLDTARSLAEILPPPGPAKLAQAGEPRRGGDAVPLKLGRGPCREPLGSHTPTL
jgi:hypothetical protein